MTEQKKTNYREVDVEALSWYLSERDLQEHTKDMDKRQVYTTEITEEGMVKEVYQNTWASWLNTQKMIWEQMIMLFTKPENNEQGESIRG